MKEEQQPKKIKGRRRIGGRGWAYPIVGAYLSSWEAKRRFEILAVRTGIPASRLAGTLLEEATTRAETEAGSAPPAPSLPPI